jgi:hypothetical protein
MAPCIPVKSWCILFFMKKTEVNKQNTSAYTWHKNCHLDSDRASLAWSVIDEEKMLSIILKPDGRKAARPAGFAGSLAGSRTTARGSRPYR